MSVLLVGPGACSGGASTASGDRSLYGVEISGKIGTAPTARIAAPLAVPSATSAVAVAGSGPPVQIDQLFVVDLTLFNGRTGDRVASTLDPGRVPLVAKSSDDSLFPALVSALIGKAQGSRIVVALPPQDAFGTGGVPPSGLEPTDPVVVVADVLAVPPVDVARHASGRPVEIPAGAPVVDLIAGDPTSIRIPDGSPSPSQFAVFPLIEGSGPPVRDHSLVAVDFLGQEWTGTSAFVDTYFKEPVIVPIGAAGSVPAWDQALVGLPAGSRVLVIDPTPPDRVPGVAKAQERGTIAWVVDVLGVS